MHHYKVARDGFRSDILELQTMGRCIDQLRSLDQGCRLGEPGRIPEGLHFAPHLIAGTGAAIEAVI
jgi:hypothetical protein